MIAFDIQVQRPSFIVACKGELGTGITTLMGPSGSGKTTLMKALAGLVKPQSGSIRLAGTTWYSSEDHCFLKPQEREVGYMPQGAVVFPHMTVKENICYSKKGDSSLYHRILDTLSLGPYEKKNVRLLSGGEQQRVALGRALYANPKVLLLDEPFSALDATLRHQLSRELVAIIQEWKIPCLWITHVEEVGLKGALKWTMEKGRLVM